jgi:hypothetical protein
VESATSVPGLVHGAYRRVGAARAETCAAISRRSADLEGTAYVYLDDRFLEYVTFRNYVRGARKSRSH